MNSNIRTDADIKKALAKAAKMRFAQELKNANEKERPFTKAYLAQQLHEKCHFDLALCNKTLDSLCAALFNEQAPPSELVPQQQAAEELAAPTKKKVASGKGVYILLSIILILLAVIAAGVWHKVWQLHTEPEVLLCKKLQQRKYIEIEVEEEEEEEEEFTTDDTDGILIYFYFYSSVRSVVKNS